MTNYNKKNNKRVNNAKIFDVSSLHDQIDKAEDILQEEDVAITKRFQMSEEDSSEDEEIGRLLRKRNLSTEQVYSEKEIADAKITMSLGTMSKSIAGFFGFFAIFIPVVFFILKLIFVTNDRYESDRKEHSGKHEVGVELIYTISKKVDENSSEIKQLKDRVLKMENISESKWNYHDTEQEKRFGTLEMKVNRLEIKTGDQR